MLKKHFNAYEDKINDESMDEHRRWARSLTEEELKFALNQENHPLYGGRRPRPKLPTLKHLVFVYRDQKPAFKPPLIKDRGYVGITSKPYCRYCTDGDVWDIINEDMEVRMIGRCKHCSGGDAEPKMLGMMEKYPNLSAQEIFTRACAIKIAGSFSVNYSHGDDLAIQLARFEFYALALMAKVRDPEGFDEAVENKIAEIEKETAKIGEKYPNRNEEIPF